jgi:hypothetical protein
MYSGLYQEFKLSVLEITGLSRDAIHIYVGLFVFFSVVVALRKGRVEAIALIPVALVASLMEVTDLYDNYRTLNSIGWGNSLHDVVNTAFWPVTIVLLAKFTRAFRQRT